MKRFYLFSLGCKVNSYENNAIGTMLIQKGYQKVNSPEEADAIILNTCSVTSRADQKSRQHISKMRKLNPNAVLLVMGCYSQLHSGVAEELGADIVLGGSERERAYEFLEEFFVKHEKIVAVKKTMRMEKYDEFGVCSFSEMTRAYLKIQDGCNNFCSYCLIPTTRGNSRSREPERVIEEAKRLVEEGFQEIIVTGIHIGAYGLDLGDGSYRLADLLEDVLKACPSLYRLRSSS
ncbi:MAG: radical SAM protein [Bacilli bacterium]|nr:radical SAM protein [Bacilli bacterium]